MGTIQVGTLRKILQILMEPISPIDSILRQRSEEDFKGGGIYRFSDWWVSLWKFLVPLSASQVSLYLTKPKKFAPDNGFRIFFEFLSAFERSFRSLRVWYRYGFFQPWYSWISIRLFHFFTSGLQSPRISKNLTFVFKCQDTAAKTQRFSLWAFKMNDEHFSLQ